MERRGDAIEQDADEHSAGSGGPASSGTRTGVAVLIGVALGLSVAGAAWWAASEGSGGSSHSAQPRSAQSGPHGTDQLVESDLNDTPIAQGADGDSKAERDESESRAEQSAEDLFQRSKALATEDNARAIELLREAAERGHARAQFNLGVKYDHGEGVPENDATAVEWFRKAAEQGYAGAQSNLGVMYADGEGLPENDATAVEWFRKAAERGYAAAQYNLGVMYANGQGVPKNAATAVAWYRKAAEQGDAAAQYNLGLMYYNGEGVAQNAATAVEWFRKAAEQGDAGAQYNLGVIYAMGDGVVQDPVSAYMWINLAAAQGDQGAAQLREDLEKIMTRDQIAEAQRRAAAFEPEPQGD